MAGARRRLHLHDQRRESASSSSCAGPAGTASLSTLRMRTADQPIRISLFAPDGRMGKAIATAVAEDPGFELDQDHGDVLVDFSAPAALQASLDRAVSAGVPILIGTT